MIVEIGGGVGGFKEYLETGQKKGRELHRNQLDQRIPLFGDLDVFEIATATHEGSGQRYDHITLSFVENHVTDEMLKIAVDEFRDHALIAWPESERHRVAFYAEAHRPKILAYINAETGETIERLTHIHVGIGRRDLETGKAIEPLGYLGTGSDNLKYIDSFQESFNSRHGIASPKDNPKITPENAVDTLARYTGARPDVLGKFNQRKAVLEITLQKEILANDITSWADFSKLLETHGVVSAMHKGKFNECFRVQPNGSDRAMRLTGNFFQRGFIERSTKEKLSIITDKATAAYLEQMQPRKAPAYLAETLNEWRTIKAREHRYLHTGSKFYKEVYKPADDETRLQILNNLERNHRAKPSAVSDQNRKFTATRGRVRRLPLRNVDGIKRRSEMLLRSYHGLHVPDESKGTRNRMGVRQADGRSENSLGVSSGTSNNSNQLIDSGVTQPSSVISHVFAELRERYEQAADKDRYTEIRQNIDCAQLLNHLSHSHGLNPELYQVVSAKDGTPRLQCGSRALSPNDFLTKELGLPWKEAAPVLRHVYELQINSRVVKPRSLKTQPSRLWVEFKAEQQIIKVGLSQRLKEFDSVAKSRRAALSNLLKHEQKSVLSGLTGAERKAALSLEKLRIARVKLEFNDAMKQERQLLRDSIQQGKSWQLYLQSRAQEGGDEALVALRKLDKTARLKHISTPSIIGRIILDEDDEKQRYRFAMVAFKQLSHAVAINGDVTYYHNGRAILRDEGRHLAVLDEHSEEAIVSGLLIAREKFGGTLTLRGSAEFQSRVVAVAVSQGIAVKFTDPALDEMRLHLIQEKRQAIQPVHMPVGKKPESTPQFSTSINKLTQQKHVYGAASSTVEKHAADQYQKVAVAIPAVQMLPLSAVEWISAQYKSQVQPHKFGDGVVEFNVVYVASDGVVIDHGRAVAMYQVPPGVELHVGQKITINKSGLIVVPTGKTQQVVKGRAD